MRYTVVAGVQHLAGRRLHREKASLITGKMTGLIERAPAWVFISLGNVMEGIEAYLR